MSAGVEVVYDKVRRYMAELCPNGYETLPNGILSGRTGSTRLFIGVGGLGAGLTRVGISAPVLLDVAASAQLFEYVAMAPARYPFGRILVRPTENPALVELLYEHSLLGDYLDQEEFNVAVSIVGQAADQLDDEMQARFGGRRLHPDAR